MASFQDDKQKFKTIVYGYIRKKTKKLRSNISSHGMPSEIIEIVVLFYGNGKDKLDKVVVKVGMLGDSQTGKTDLMRKYVCNRYDEDYIETLGVNFMERNIPLKNVDVTISIWDMGGHKEYATMMPLVCSDAKIILFVFDLTSRQTLLSIKKWYKEARKESKVMITNKFIYILIICNINPPTTKLK